MKLLNLLDAFYIHLLNLSGLTVLKDLSTYLYVEFGGDQIRTDDLLRARQLLSQLSYTPRSTININYLF